MLEGGGVGGAGAELPEQRRMGSRGGPRLGIKKALQREQATALRPAVHQTAFAWSLQPANSWHPETVCLEKPCSPA